MKRANRYADSYSICWNSPSADSSESMPLGGGDVGLNVWVEDGDVFFYMAKGDAFDSYNHLLKLGRVRLRFDPNPFLDARELAQALRLRDGCIEINAVHDDCGKLWLRLWVERTRPVIHVSAQSSRPLALDAAYESWRTYDRELPLDRRQSRFHAFGTSGLPARVVVKSDVIGFGNADVEWYHRNAGKTIFDYEVEQQGLDADTSFLWNPLQNRTFGGRMTGVGLIPNGTQSGRYMSNLYSGWRLSSQRRSKSQEINVFLHCAQTPSLEDWKEGLQELVKDNSVPLEERWQEHREWWNAFWERSFIAVAPDEPESAAWQVGRNYQLFRFMLGCTSHGPYPTKFNGGFFTFDPQKIPDDYLRNSGEPPDYRKWGGGSYTAQNQRLLYWPLLKSGDFDMMRPQFEFYRRALANASLRVRRYWGHAGCCFTEQMNQYGLPIGATYGWDDSYVEGRERRAEYEDGVEVVSAVSMLYESQLEFAWMILLAHQYTELDIERYLPFIEQAVIFYDEHYRARQRQRTQTEYGPDGKLVLYPSNTLEDHRDARNPASVIAGLTRVLRALLDLPATCQSAEKKQRWRTILEHLPPYPLGMGCGFPPPCSRQHADRRQGAQRSHRCTGGGARSPSSRCRCFGTVFPRYHQLTKPGGVCQ